MMESSDMDQFTTLVKDLAEEARKDGKFTSQELELLKQISFDIRVYQRTLKKAEEDGVITAEEMQQLEDVKQKVISNAVDVANFDETMDEDEKSIIDKLTKILLKGK